MDIIKTCRPPWYNLVQQKSIKFSFYYMLPEFCPWYPSLCSQDDTICSKCHCHSQLPHVVPSLKIVPGTHCTNSSSPHKIPHYHHLGYCWSHCTQAHSHLKMISQVQTSWVVSSLFTHLVQTSLPLSMLLSVLSLSAFSLLSLHVPSMII